MAVTEFMTESTPYSLNYWLKTDAVGRWLEQEWIPNRPEDDLIILWTSDITLNQHVMSKFDKSEAVEGWLLESVEKQDSPAAVEINVATYLGELTLHTGTYLFRFQSADDPATTTEVLVIGSYYEDHDSEMIVLACLPKPFVAVWRQFENECHRLAHPRSKVTIIGGRQGSFEPKVEWDDVILPDSLKSELMEDVNSFFSKGIDIYKRLKLKPFRKLLLAGVPGTGKTMLCNALAKWALERDYLVIYVSSADNSGSTFGKIQHALHVAANANKPSLVLLEELDAYLHEEEKALVLNVLDGSESSENDHGTLLVATTNYPEAIDERVLKRPGRLDRIYIIPEIDTAASAELMLRQYLDTMWRDEHAAIAEKLVGYPGAFIREVAVYALTLVAYDDLHDVSLEMLERSYNRLKEQIDARDNFLDKYRRNGKSVGFQIHEG